MKKAFSHKWIALAACAALAIAASIGASAQGLHKVDSIKGSNFRPAKVQEEMVIVKGDTISNIIKEKNYGRFDRGLFNYLYLPKGQWLFGLTASYAKFDSKDYQLLSVLKDLDFEGSILSFHPSVAYVISHNNTLGIRLGYARNDFDLGSLKVDFDDDINFNLKDVDYYTKTLSAEVFYRHYLGLNNSRRFAIFNEVALGIASSDGKFVREYNEKPRQTDNTSTRFSLNFSPGVNIFIVEQMSFNVSFGVFGWYINRDHQTTDSEVKGSRTASGANFKFNLFNLNFGMTLHI
jgi:hypothetical protein